MFKKILSFLGIGETKPVITPAPVPPSVPTPAPVPPPKPLSIPVNEIAVSDTLTAEVTRPKRKPRKKRATKNN